MNDQVRREGTEFFSFVLEYAATNSVITATEGVANSVTYLLSSLISQ